MVLTGSDDGSVLLESEVAFSLDSEEVDVAASPATFSGSGSASSPRSWTSFNAALR